MADPLLVWDAAAGKYRRANGQYISPGVVRSELDKALAAAAQRNTMLVDDLRAGRISLDAWRSEMRQSIKDVNIYSATLARGGWNQMDQVAWGRVGSLVKEDYGYLESWVTDIKAGALIDGRANSRSGLYAASGRGTFHLVQAEEMVKSGIDEEKSVTHPAEHCQECLDEEDAGFRPIGEMIPIGARTCGPNCRCTVVYRRSATGQVFGDTVGPEVPGATGADILAQPSAAYPPARPDERETTNTFTTAGGRLTPERQRLHDAIVRQHFQGVKPVANPTVYVMGGGPASGKSVMLGKLDTPSNVVTVDPDHIKTLLPEFREGTARGDAHAGTMVHEESSALAKRIVAEAVRDRYQIVVDGTGDNSYENLTRKVESYRAGGAQIVANYVTVDTETAVARAYSRGVRTGRFVPETFLREVHRNISDIIPRAIEDGLYDELTIWDNNGAAGAATQIARYRDGQLTVLDENLWQRFLAKAE